MIKKALEYLIGLGQAETHYVGGQNWSDKPLHLLEEPIAAAITVHSLSGLIGYVKEEFDTGFKSNKLMIHVVSPTNVILYDALNENANRSKYILASALIPNFDFDYFYDAETFNIKLQSCFVKNEDRDIMLQVVGNIKEDNVKEIGDDGISQAVVAKTGVASVGNVKVPNPVVLKPYRTFVEVDQPESEFVFRMQNGPRCALFEADGGAWMLEAMENIKKYLKNELKEEIEAKKVFIIA